MAIWRSIGNGWGSEEANLLIINVKYHKIPDRHSRISFLIPCF